MLTTEQFKELLAVMSINQQDRERFVRMETMLSVIVDSEVKCRADMVCRIEEAKKKAKDACDRIDQEVHARYLFAGGIGAVGIICSVGVLILKLTGKM